MYVSNKIFKNQIGTQSNHPQNKVPEVGVFFRVEKLAANNHLHHAKHHKLTTKTPHVAPRFCEKPLQNIDSPRHRKRRKKVQQRSVAPSKSS
ncbi:hypothetical protein [Tunturiibacter lichenicola]|uniref:hypothetical protein n=1 Tax=Tunturiibacter lichenicola TaxID=2051959 RepID=UPI0021B25B86|nr:hypothetical protein [Edaphobacter lichenicola]